MINVAALQQAFREFVRDNTFPYVIRYGKIVEVNKEFKECKVELPKGITLQGVKFKDIVPVKGDDIYIASYDSEGLKYHILDQSIQTKESSDIKFTGDYKINANKLDLTAEKINLNTEYIKLGKLKEVLLELVDLNIEMINTQATAAPALLNKAILPKLQEVKTNLDTQLL